MPRIQRAILLELATLFLLALLVTTAVMFAGLTFQVMGNTQGMEVRFLLALLPPLLPLALAYAIPYAFLLSVSLVYGRMAADRELIALRISGVHPRVIVMPAVALGAVLSLATFACTGWLVPESAHVMRRQRENLVDLFLGQLAGADRTVTLQKFRLSFGSYEPAERPGGLGTFRDFELDRRSRQGELLQKLLGPEARFRRHGGELQILADQAYAFGEDPAGGAKVTGGPARLEVGHVEALGATAEFNDVLGRERFEAKAKDLSLTDLLYLVGRGDTVTTRHARTSTELHGRLAAAFAPLVFGLMAAAVCLHLSPRSLRLLGFLLAFLPALLVHFPLLVAGKSLAIGGTLPAWLGMWGGDLVLFAAGLFLLVKASIR